MKHRLRTYCYPCDELVTLLRSFLVLLSHWNILEGSALFNANFQVLEVLFPNMELSVPHEAEGIELLNAFLIQRGAFKVAILIESVMVSLYLKTMARSALRNQVGCRRLRTNIIAEGILT